MFESMLTADQRKLRDDVREFVRSVPRQLILDMDADRVQCANYLGGVELWPTNQGGLGSSMDQVAGQVATQFLPTVGLMLLLTGSRYSQAESLHYHVPQEMRS